MYHLRWYSTWSMAYASAGLSGSGVRGARRRRTPAASKTALARNVINRALVGNRGRQREPVGCIGDNHRILACPLALMAWLNEFLFQV